MNALRSLLFARIQRMTVSAFVLSALLTSPALAKDPFEGRVKMEVDHPQGKQTLDYFVKGERMRIVPNQGEGQGHVIILDMDEKQVLMLMPDQKMYMAMPVPDMAEGQEEDQKRPEPQDETKEILGHQARKYTFESAGSDYEIWATDELGKLGGLNLPGGRPGSSQAQAISQEDFFPLLIVERKGGREHSRVEVTEVEPREVEEDLFEPPADYQKMEMPSPGGPRQ